MPTISLGFDNSAQTQKNIMITMEVPLQENEHIWAWDHYFSHVLNLLCENNESTELMEILSSWSKGFAKNMALSYEELSKKNLLTLSQDIKIFSHMENCSQLYFIEISSQEGHWPNVHIKIPDDAAPEDLRDSVIGLAEFFLTQNKYFYRELPLHMLSMQKFYQEQADYSDEAAIIQAPAFAFDTAFKFIQQLKQTNNH